MIALICTRDVIMRRSYEVAFKAGNVYYFNMSGDGSIHRYDVNSGYHSFSNDSWHDFFKFELEKEDA